MIVQFFAARVNSWDFVLRIRNHFVLLGGFCEKSGKYHGFSRRGEAIAFAASLG